MPVSSPTSERPPSDAQIAATARPPLWRDVRVLQWVFQIAVVAVSLLLLFWLYDNYRVNSEEKNIPTDFGFLDNPASFTIPGNSMSQSAPVRDAMVEGLLNTLRVALAGVVAATVLGTIIGIARLSTNWVVNKMAASYVEAVRNIPLYIFLLFGNLVLILNVFPPIQEAWDPLGVFVISNRGLGIPWYEGGSNVGILVLWIVGLAAAWAVSRWRHAVADRTGDLARAGLWGGLVFLAILFGGFFALGYSVTTPMVDGRQIEGGMGIDPSFFALFFALVIYTASHIAEIVRGSIQAVPKGQGEAASALALSGFQRMWYVVLPQAFRIAIPPLGNQYLNLIKNSSLGAAISYAELTLVARTTVGNGSPAVPAFALTMVIYIVISLIVSAVVNVANRRLALDER